MIGDQYISGNVIVIEVDYDWHLFWLICFCLVVRGPWFECRFDKNLSLKVVLVNKKKWTIAGEVLASRGERQKDVMDIFQVNHENMRTITKMRTRCPDHLQKQNTVVDFINQPILRTICWIKRWSRLSADTNLTWSWAWYQSKRKPIDDEWKRTFLKNFDKQKSQPDSSLLVGLFTTQMYFHGFTNYRKIKFSLREKD